MATQTETTLKMFHAPHDQMAFKHDRSIQTESSGRHDNLTSQPFAGFEFLSGNAIESFAAEILRRTLNGFSSDPPEQTHPPMHRYPLAFAAIIREGYGGCGRVSKKEKGPRNFPGDRAILLMVSQNNHLREFCEEPIPPSRQVYTDEDNLDTKNLPPEKAGVSKLTKILPAQTTINVTAR